MIKKAILAGVVLMAGVAVFAFTPARSYIQTMFGYASEAWQPSLEFEIRRAENLIKDLQPKIEESQETLARNKVTLRKLKDDVVKLQNKADTEHAKLVAMRKRLGNGEQLVSIDNSTRDQLQRQLKRVRFAASTLKSTQRRHDALEKHYFALRDKVKEMDAQQEDAKRALDALKAELAAVQVDEMHAKQTVDDSEFARVQKLLNKIDTEIKTRQELVNMRSGDYDDEDTETPVSPTANTDVVDEVDAYLQSNDGPRVAGK